MGIQTIVQKILQDVKTNGNQALFKYTSQFDNFQLTPKTIQIPKTKLEQAWLTTPIKIQKTLITAKKNIEKFHKEQLPHPWKMKLPRGVVLGQIFRPIEKVGVYVPGGRAPLVSSVLMTVTPARVSGVKKITLVTPPPANKYILAAAYLAGADVVYQIGGAQAIAALAYGTKTIPKVDKIVGPGNIYVTTAKKMVFGEVDIDMPAGPSEILIIADKTGKPEYIALDLLSQLEHDPLSKATLISTSLKGIKTEINKQLKNLSRKNVISKKGLRLIKVSNINKAIDLCNKIAPEHLELMAKNPEKLIPRIQNAGIILIGPSSPVALSDFIVGTNHVLPTGGAARSFAGLNVWDFLKPISTVKYTKKAIDKAKPSIKVFSEIEGLDAHNKSVECR